MSLPPDSYTVPVIHPSPASAGQAMAGKARIIMMETVIVPLILVNARTFENLAFVQ
jgi:hypothetical protein